MIEPATAADLDAIAEIELHSFPRAVPRDPLAAELANPLAHIAVVRAPDVVAYCNYWIVEPRIAGELHIMSIATHPDHRRAGLGAALLGHAIAAGRAAGCTLATLEVRRSNTAAIALYARFGFATVHVRRGYYPGPGEGGGEDALVMLCALTASSP